jgi:hypothetical protein
MNKKIIVIVLVVGAVVAAGCVGGGDQAPETGDGGETSDGDGGGEGETDGGGGDGDGGGGGEGETDGGTGDGGETGDGDAGTEGATTLGNAFGMTEEFAFDTEVEGEQQTTVSGRFHQGDMYMEFESEEGEGEFYMVGGNQYTVMSGQGETLCIESPDRTPPGEGQVDPDDYESRVSEYSDITPTGRDTIDGEEVYVYELGPETTERSGTVTYYVGVDSGYLRRVESAEATVDFHSWNDVDPIDAPDMDCQDMSEMPGGGDMPDAGDMPGGGDMPDAGDMPSGP